MRNTIVGTTLLLVAGSAAAGSVDMNLPPAGGLEVDFRSDAWAGAEGQQSFEMNGIIIEAMWQDSVLAWDDEGGLGVRSTFDESFLATSGEAIRIRGVGGMTGMWLNDFAENPNDSERVYINGNLGMFDDNYGEILVDSQDDTYGQSDGTGNFFVDFQSQITGGAEFVKVRSGSGLNTTFSVLGLTAVPLPGAGMLGMAGLGGLAAFRRR